MPAEPKVLIADDEVLIAETLGLILRQGGYDCRVVYSGAAALAQSREFQPALLISDVILPDINGVEVAIRVRQLVPACEILLLSGQAATADLMREATAAGHRFHLLSKPIPPDELLRHVALRIRHLPRG